MKSHLFLIEFARAYALSVYKSVRLADMGEAAAGLSAILDVEMNLHVKLSAGWGLAPGDLEHAPPALEAATNRYRVWIEEYAGAPYQQVAGAFVPLLEDSGHCASRPRPINEYTP